MVGAAEERRRKDEARRGEGGETKPKERHGVSRVVTGGGGQAVPRAGELREGMGGGLGGGMGGGKLDPLEKLTLWRRRGKCDCSGNSWRSSRLAMDDS